MALLPFDPNKARGAEPPAPPAADQAPPLTVSQASELIKSALEQRFAAPLRIAGEISNLSQRNHWYFSLKDADAVLSCVAWATSVRRFGFAPKDGDAVVAVGHIGHYPPQGRTQLYVTMLSPIGAGPLEQRFRELCAQLRMLGYFDESRKKPLPILPRRIAVITSASSAAVQDVIATAAQRCRAVGLLLVDVKVQGDGAAEQIARAIRWVDANHVRLGVDAMLVTRGGGSIEDLWAFNERTVADAAFRCSLPLVAAIGHEADTTIIELVADVRASTPTQAAMRLVPASTELIRQIGHLSHRMQLVLHRTWRSHLQRIDEIARWDWLRKPVAMVEWRQALLQQRWLDMKAAMQRQSLAGQARLERLSARLGTLQPRTVLIQRRARLEALADRLALAAHSHIHRHRQRLEAVARQLGALDPQGVLRRGYSITMLHGQAIVRSVSQVSAGNVLTTRVADGSIESVVGGDSTRRRAAEASRVDPADQMDLFGRQR